MQIPGIPILRITPFRQGDQANLIKFLGNELYSRNTLTMPYPYTQEEADNWLAFIEENQEKHDAYIQWAIRHEDEGVIGAIGNMFKNGKDNHVDEIGYWMAVPFQGRGWMTAAVKRYCRHLYQTHGIIRVEANVFSYNPASGRVLEKAGFEAEGLRRKAYRKGDQLIDATMYAWLAQEHD